jgi:hypothetical protein
VTDGVPLFVAEPTGTCRLSLRRFRFRETSGAHFHDVSVVIGEDAPASLRDDGTRVVTGDRVPHGDPRWPTSCACGELFTDSDEWQCAEQDWFEGGGCRFAWGIGSWDGPPGAMIRATWRDSEPDNGCPAYIVFLPNGSYWCTRDRAAREGSQPGPQWTVTGTAPDITVTPSIDDRNPERPWHGWIRNGLLVPA